ncbi:MAG: glycosyltransferase family 2 protein [Acidimicrobiales bacterium]
MSAPPAGTKATAALVTVVCATRNARAAVRLTVASLLRHTTLPFRLLVADNGSTDGTLEDLQAIAGARVFSLPERQADLARRAAWQHQVLARLDERRPRAAIGDGPAAGAVVARGREALGAGRRVGHAGGPAGPWGDDGLVTLHGTTLDWLCDRVTTPFTVTLDSDVEILDPRWLPEMLSLMERQQLVALGPYEPGKGGYQARLAPHLLVLRTEEVRTLGTSFLGGTTTADPEERRRWEQRRPSFAVGLRDLAGYPTTTVYPTGAVLFQTMVARQMRWQALPPELAATFHHFGHMSWGGADDDDGGDPAVRADHATVANDVHERWLAQDYRWPPSRNVACASV